MRRRVPEILAKEIDCQRVAGVPWRQGARFTGVFIAVKNEKGGPGLLESLGAHLEEFGAACPSVDSEFSKHCEPLISPAIPNVGSGGSAGEEAAQGARAQLLGIGQQGAQGDALRGCKGGKAGEVQERGGQVVDAGVALGSIASACHAGDFHHEGDGQELFMEGGAVADSAMLEEFISMVSEDDDDGFIFQAQG